MEPNVFDKVHEVDLKKTMEQSYIDYAMSVISARALPDVRDGLKPVQRRVLYSMIELNNGPDKPHRKCARIVGDTMGKYHPHGDSSIYGALVNMAQEWSTRYPLVDGHGNFGSVDGDGAAAMRYTEARLSKISMEMLADINKDTVDFVPNFDETEREPLVLPSRYPNLLVNGTSGIAVGMATNIPPHNLREIIGAVVKMIDNRVEEDRETSLEEIMEIGDHVTILRDGKYVADADVKDIELSWIVENMVGKNTQYHRFERSIDLSKQPKVLEIKNMCLPKKGGGWTLDHVSLDLKKGEVLGVYGLLGAGRSELFECLMGLHPEHTGDVLYEGKKLNIKDVAAQIKNGFALVPEDRQSQGLIQTLDIGKNTAISSMKDYVKGLFLDEKAENAAVDEQIKDIHIKVADKRLPILSLSGGNQQKVVIGKGLLTKPKILLLDEPSRGIDIGAKTEVFEIIHDLAEKGLSIIVISSELKEIMAIADRIVVLSNGKKTGELTGDEITEDTLVRTSYAGLGTGRNA